jgi:hypothetical protein
MMRLFTLWNITISKHHPSCLSTLATAIHHFGLCKEEHHAPILEPTSMLTGKEKEAQSLQSPQLPTP